MIFMYFQEEDIRSMLAAKFQVFSTFGSNFNLAGGSFDLLFRLLEKYKNNTHIPFIKSCFRFYIC